MDLMHLTQEDIKYCNVYDVQWFPPYCGDCEPKNTWVFAPTAKDALNYPRLKKVIVSYARLITGEEKEDALKYHWCDNDPYHKLAK